MKIGFIDYFIDEWHANNYPDWIRKSPESSGFELGLAWEKKTADSGLDLKKWCAGKGMSPAASPEEVVDNSDCIVVLSPDNSEMHEELAHYALQSGKCVYVDKTFAPDYAAALRMFTLAGEYGTPLMTTSALRYPEKLNQILKNDVAGQKVNCAVTFGGGRCWEIYGIHQIEMLVHSIGTGAVKVLASQGGNCASFQVDYDDGRLGVMNYMPQENFQITLQYGDAEKSAQTGALGGDFFQLFINDMLRFFRSGKTPVPQEETLEAMRLVEKTNMALKTPGKWVHI